MTDETPTFFDFDLYQSEAAKTAKYPRQHALAYTALGLAGEAGEYANGVKKLLRGDPEAPSTEAMLKELGDALWYVAACARELHTPLSEVARMNLRKLNDRDERNVIKGSGDDR